MVIIDYLDALPLQWGRLPKEAETARRALGTEGPARFNGAASRRRRRLLVLVLEAVEALGFNGAASRRRRRRAHGLATAAGVQHASMGPPPEGGGDVKLAGVAEPSARLQWGRLPKEAETRRDRAARRAVGDA